MNEHEMELDFFGGDNINSDSRDLGSAKFGKRTRAEYERSRQNGRIRHTTVKAVGTRTASAEKKCQRILELAQDLPEENKLPARTIYWFVTSEEVTIYFPQESQFALKASTQTTDANGNVYHLNEVDFKQNKQQSIDFKFPDGTLEQVHCVPRGPNQSNKRARTSNANSVADDESQFPTYITLPNQNDFSPINSNNQPTPLHVPAYYSQPQVVGDQTFSINNTIILVPDDDQYIQMIEDTLTSIGFKKEISSASRQSLYSFQTLSMYNVLIFPYGTMDGALRLRDYLKAVCEVILLVDNKTLEDPLTIDNGECFATITKIHNIKAVINNIIQLTAWDLLVKETTTMFTLTELDYSTLPAEATRLFAISDLKKTLLGGLSCTHPLKGKFDEFLSSWLISPFVTTPTAQHIYLCFKFEPRPLQTFSELAEKTLAALKIDKERVEIFYAHGSMLIFMRCPTHLVWYILLRKDDICTSLANEGFVEMHECYIRDVERALNQPENTEFADELTYLMEQMISDGIAASFRTRFDQLSLTNSTKSTESEYNDEFLVGNLEEMIVQSTDKCELLQNWLTKNSPLNFQTCIGFLSDLLVIAHRLTELGLEHGDMIEDTLVVSNSAGLLRLKLLHLHRVVSEYDELLLQKVHDNFLHIIDQCDDIKEKGQFMHNIFRRGYMHDHSYLTKHVVLTRDYPMIAKFPFFHLDEFEAVRPESYDAAYIKATVTLPEDRNVWTLLDDPNAALHLPSQCLNRAHPSVPDSVYNEITAEVTSSETLSNGVTLAIKRIRLHPPVMHFDFELTTHVHHAAMKVAWMNHLSATQRTEHIEDKNKEFWGSFGVQLGVKTADGHLTFVCHSNPQNKEEVSFISCGFSEAVSVKDIEKDSDRVNLFNTARRGLKELNIVLDNNSPIKFIGVNCEYRDMTRSLMGVVEFTDTKYTKDHITSLLRDPESPSNEKFSTKELIFVPTRLNDVFDFLVRNGPSLEPGCFACTLCCLYHSFGEMETDAALIHYLRAKSLE